MLFLFCQYNQELPSTAGAASGCGKRMLEINEQDGAVVFTVRVQARARRDAIEGLWQGALRVRLTAPPAGGRANEALRRLLAAHLNIPVSAVRILAGERSRTKRIAVRGASVAQVRSLVTTQT